MALPGGAPDRMELLLRTPGSDASFAVPVETSDGEPAPVDEEGNPLMRTRTNRELGPEFDDYEGAAVWEDLKLGARHPASFERIAVVTDARWAAPAIRMFSVLWPGEARAFRLRELESAKLWAAQGTE